MNVTELFWQWAEACVAKEVDAIADLYCADATHAFPFREGAPVIEGREAIRRHLAEGFARAPVSFSGVRHAIVHHTEDPHTVIAECTFEGTLTSTGAAFQPSYVEVLTERDGLIGAVRDYENLAYRAARE
ncbi:MAG: nuclear transport factor 2 family protein, partial [Streptosporangiaceae bacterium]